MIGLSLPWLREGEGRLEEAGKSRRESLDRFVHFGFFIFQFSLPHPLQFLFPLDCFNQQTLGRGLVDFSSSLFCSFEKEGCVAIQ